jgi:transposase
VPGIGKLGAYTLVLEIDTIQRFPTVRHLHSSCRVVPGADNSAGKTRHKRSRDGNRYLKQVFHTAAIRAAQYHPEIRREYRRLARRKGKDRGAGADRGAREYRLLCAAQAGGVPWSISWTRPNAEAPAVAAAGEPEQSN